MSRRQFKAAILEYEAFTGQRHLIARRLFNAMLRGGGVDNPIESLASSMVNLLNETSTLSTLSNLLAVYGIKKRLQEMKKTDKHPVLTFMTIVMENLSTIVNTTEMHPELTALIQWAPTLIELLIWVNVQYKLHTLHKESELVKTRIETLRTEPGAPSKEQMMKIEQMKWYHLAAELQEHKSHQFRGTVSPPTVLTIAQLSARQQKQEKAPAHMDMLKGQLTVQGKEKVDQFVKLSTMAKLKNFGQLRRVLTVEDVVDVGHWSQTEPAVKFISTTKEEWLGYRKDGNWKLDPTWNSEDPRPDTEFNRIEMGRWINGIFEGTYTIEDHNRWWKWTSTDHNLGKYLERIRLYPLRSWRDLILDLQNGNGTEQEKALWKIQLKSQLTKSGQNKVKEDKDWAKEDWAKLRRELQGEDMDFTLAAKQELVDIVPAIRIQGKVQDQMKEWLFYYHTPDKSWKLDATWGEQELPANATTIITIEKGSLLDWFWSGTEKLELTELGIDTQYKFEGETWNYYFTRMQSLLKHSLTSSKPVSGREMAEQTEQQMKDKMKMLERASEWLSTLPLS